LQKKKTKNEKQIRVSGGQRMTQCPFFLNG
jgi:hypothetical protein